MRRGGAPPMLAVDPALVPAFSRVDRGPRGIRLAPAALPDGLTPAPGPDMVLESGVPVPLRAGTVVAGGTLALGVGALGGVAYSFAVPRIRVVHDRRPPGLDRLAGAAEVNAGLLHADGGWRAVVLPSLGDVAADLGEGPVALRADGRRLAIAVAGGVEEADLGADGTPVRHDGAADALAYAGETLFVARGAAVGGPDIAPGEGSPVIALAGASRAARAAALHADGTVTIWEAGAGAPVARWASPAAGSATIAMSPDGAHVELGVPEGPEPAACIARADDGAVVRRVEGARVLAATADGTGVLVAGDWGAAWLIPPPEETA